MVQCAQTCNGMANTYLSDTMSSNTTHDQQDTKIVNAIENESLNGNSPTYIQNA